MMACFASDNQTEAFSFFYVFWVETVFNFRDTKDGEKDRFIEICFKKIRFD